MSGKTALKQAASITGFTFRHLVASLVSIVLPVLLVTLVYFLLLLYALVMDEGIGSPVALPFWMFFSLVLSALYTTFLLFPTVMLAEVITKRSEKWSHLAQIPVSALLLGMITLIVCQLVRLLPSYPKVGMLHWAEYPLYVFLGLLVPLGIYWWTMKIVQTGTSLPFFLIKRLKRMSGPH